MLPLNTNPFPNSTSKHINPFNITIDPIIEMFIACALNTSVCAYQISKEKIKHLKTSQFLTLAFKLTHPTIPAFNLILGIGLLSSIALRILKIRNETFDKIFSELSRFSTINTLALANLTFMIHELGHAFLAKAFFVNPRIKIEIFPFLGGQTTYAVSYGLNNIGNFFGKERAILLITAGGFISSMTTCLLLTMLEKQSKNHKSFVIKCLHTLSLNLILSELIYGIASFIENEPNLQNDFTYLKTAGSIHPLLPVSLMVAASFYSIY